MKILALLSQDLYRLSFGWVLQTLGHQVHFLHEAKAEEFENTVRLFNPDIFLDMGWDTPQQKKEQREILSYELKRLNLYHVYFAEEDYLHFENFSKPYVLEVPTQFVLTRSPDCVKEYQKLGIKAAYLDVGFNKELHHSMPPDINLECDVSVVANVQYFWDIYRRKCITNLVVPLFNQPYRLKIWGRDWDKTDKYFGKLPPAGVHLGILPFYNTPRVYSSSKINISIQSLEDQISNRTYDILACGGFLLTSDTPAVREKLTPGLHCEVSTSPEDTNEKVRYYLSNNEARERIAKAGCLYARDRFSYQKTLPKLLNQIYADVLLRGKC